MLYPQPRNKNLGFEALDSSRLLDLRGGNSQAHRDSPRDLESTSLGLRILSLRIGRSDCAALPFAARHGASLHDAGLGRAVLCFVM